jgi:hypothetical protein
LRSGLLCFSFSASNFAAIATARFTMTTGMLAAAATYEASNKARLREEGREGEGEDGRATDCKYVACIHRYQVIRYILSIVVCVCVWCCGVRG